MKKLKFTAKLGTTLLALHLIGLAVPAAEKLVAERARAIYRQVGAGLARANGYVPTEPALSMRELAEREALRHKLNPALVRALIRTESAGKKHAISPKGALGPMQVMPFNASICGLEIGELVDPEKNIRCGTSILARNLRTYNDDLLKALMVYNGGPGALKAPKDETVNHARSVLRHLARDVS